MALFPGSPGDRMSTAEAENLACTRSSVAVQLHQVVPGEIEILPWRYRDDPIGRFSGTKAKRIHIRFYGGRQLHTEDSQLFLYLTYRNHADIMANALGPEKHHTLT